MLTAANFAMKSQEVVVSQNADPDTLAIEPMKSQQEVTKVKPQPQPGISPNKFLDNPQNHEAPLQKREKQTKPPVERSSEPSVLSATFMASHGFLEVNSVLHNPTSSPLEAAAITVQVVERGRTIPLIEENHRIVLRGGIEPNESATVQQTIRLLDRYPPNTWPGGGGRQIKVFLTAFLPYKAEQATQLANPDFVFAVETDYYDNPPPKDRIESSKESPMNPLESAIRQMEKKRP